MNAGSVRPYRTAKQKRRVLAAAAGVYAAAAASPGAPADILPAAGA